MWLLYTQAYYQKYTPIKKKKKAQWDADISIAVKCLNYLEPSLKQKGNKTFIGSDVMANLMDMKDYGVIVDRSIN